MAMNGPLSGIRILDAGHGMSAALAAKLLAEAGAEVLRMEIDGDPLAEVYPAYPLWHALAHKVTPGPDGLLTEERLRDADVVLIGGDAHPAIAAAPTAEDILAAYPRLVILDIAAKPAGLDDYETPGHDLLAQARSGAAFEAFSDRPVHLAFPAPSYGAGIMGTIGLVAALFEREKSGQGQIVRTSLVQGALAWLGPLWLRAAQPTRGTDMVVPKSSRHTIFRCADSVYVHFALGVPNAVKNLDALLGNTEPHRGLDARGLPTGEDIANYFGDIDLIQRYIGAWQSGPLIAALRAAGIPTEKVMDPGECWDEPQVQANGIIASDATGRRYVGNPIKGFHA